MGLLEGDFPLFSFRGRNFHYSLRDKRKKGSEIPIPSSIGSLKGRSAWPGSSTEKERSRGCRFLSSSGSQWLCCLRMLSMRRIAKVGRETLYC